MTWAKGYRRGSTIFKVVLNKKGKLDYYLCVICGDKFSNILFNHVYESHETMHLLQQLLANHGIQKPIMQEEQELE